MKTLIIVLSLLSISCVRTVEKIVYVDKIKYVHCEIIEPLKIERPKLKQVSGPMCSVNSFGALLGNTLDLIEYAKKLEWEIKRYKKMVKRCEEMKKEESNE